MTLTNNDLRDAATLGAMLAKLPLASARGPSRIGADALIFIRHSRALRLLAEKQHNSGLTDADKRRKACRFISVQALAGLYGIAALHNSDPRGNAIILFDPANASDIETGEDNSKLVPRNNIGGGFTV